MVDQQNPPQTQQEKSTEESKKLGRAGLGAMAGVLLSRTSGILRTLAVNATFGIGLSLDAFNAAFRFPNALRDLFADGALSAAFIRSLVEAERRGPDAERHLIGIVTGFFCCVTFGLAIFGAFFSEFFMKFVGGHTLTDSSDGLALATSLFKILAFYLPLTMLNAIAMAILGVKGLTFRAMNGSIFLSGGMIAGTLLPESLFLRFGYHPVTGLALGAMLGAILQIFYQFKPAKALGIVPFPNFNPKQWLFSRELRKILVMMTPRAIGQGAATVALLINTMFAMRAGEGVLTYIVTAVTIIQVPIGLFGVATGFAAQPLLTAAADEKNEKKFSLMLVESLETVLWLSAITSACFALFIVPFYSTLFAHGRVTFHDTIMNSLAVCAYSIGIIFSASSKVLSNAFYAIDSTRQVAWNALAYLIINASLSALLAPRFGMIGLGISYGTASALDFLMNFYFLRVMFNRKVSEKFDPYSAGGEKFFQKKVLFFCIFSYISAAIGLTLIHLFWEKFFERTGIHLNFIYSLAILLIGGGVFSFFSVPLIQKYGPPPLKRLLTKTLRLLKIKTS